MSNHHTLDELASLVAVLRGPDGCPWDREQTLGDLRAYLLEEAHEVAAAIDGDDLGSLFEELGDLLFHIVFISSLADLDLEALIGGVHRKMVARHPHVFGEEHPLEDAVAVKRSWERQKARSADSAEFFSGVPPTLPALTAAYRMTQKASGIGFDWTNTGDVLDKVREELSEVEESLPQSSGRRREEIGDLLFAIVNLARHLEIDPEAALARGNLKFKSRFEAMVAFLDKPLAEATMDEMQAAWDRAKA